MEIKLVGEQIGDHISRSLESGDYTSFRAAVAYAKWSGVGKIESQLSNFKNSGYSSEFILGIDQLGTTYQALASLIGISSNVSIFHQKGWRSFHPKVYIFGEEPSSSKVIVGSSNLTAGGLYNNKEVSVVIDKPDYNFFEEIENYWSSLKEGSKRNINRRYIEELLRSGLIADEREISQSSSQKRKDAYDDLAGEKFPAGDKIKSVSPNEPPSVTFDLPANYAMTLSAFDVSPASQEPIILIPKAARDKYPTFWRWPDLFRFPDTSYPDRYIPACVNWGNGREDISVKLYWYETKKEFRLRCEPIKRNGNPDDIIHCTRSVDGDIEYEIDLIRSGTERHQEVMRHLTHEVSSPSSSKKWGYY